jgi:hypothetical protein
MKENKEPSFYEETRCIQENSHVYPGLIVRVYKPIRRKFQNKWTSGGLLAVVLDGSLCQCLAIPEKEKGRG